MEYTLKLMPSVERYLDRVPRAIQVRLVSAIRGLAGTPRPHGCRKLQAYEDTYRIRVGTYRVVYRVQDDVLLVLVIRVGLRSVVYRGL